jgi:hypothetical protein
MTGGWAARCAVVLGNIARTEKVQTEKVSGTVIDPTRVFWWVVAAGQAE